MKTIDASGISCPEPLLMLKKALKDIQEGQDEILLILDSKNALNNCEQYAAKQGFSVNTTTEGDIYKIHMVKA
jgi:TusA-related sulfurtransferase